MSISKENRAAYNKQYYKRNREKHIEYQRQYHIDNPNARSTYNKQNRENIWAKKIMKQYGLSVDRFNEIFESQDSKCCICGSIDPGRKGTRWLVDHCHNTNRVRGILCHRCNTALGLVSDSIETLNNMIKYLKENS